MKPILICLAACTALTLPSVANPAFVTIVQNDATRFMFDLHWPATGQAITIPISSYDEVAVYPSGYVSSRWYMDGVPVNVQVYSGAFGFGHPEDYFQLQSSGGRTYGDLFFANPPSAEGTMIPLPDGDPFGARFVYGAAYTPEPQSVPEGEIWFSLIPVAGAAIAVARRKTRQA